MNIQILNNDLSLNGIVSGCEKVEFTRAWNNQGNFRIVINANNLNAKYLSVDKIVYIDQDKIGYIDKITIDRKTNKAGQYLIAEGVELKDRLSRVIYPDSSQINDSYTNEKLETVVKSLINKNAGSLAASARQIPNLVTAADQGRGLAVDYSARYKDLSAEIYSLLMSQEMGLKATIDFDNSDIVFDVAAGNVMTAAEGQAGGIVLSLDTKTALEITDTDDRLGVKNLSVTAGLGDNENRTIQEVYTQASEPAGYSRREVFTDARDIKSDDEIATRGAQKLGEIQKARAVSARANSLGSYHIGKDYDLGDYISVHAGDELFDSQVIKIKYRYEKSHIPEIDIVLNCDTDDALHSAITAKHMDYDALLSKDTGEHRLVAQKVFTAAANSHTFTGLDIASDGGMYEVQIHSKNSAFADINVRPNGISTGWDIVRLIASGSLTASGDITRYSSYSTSRDGIVGQVSADVFTLTKVVIMQKDTPYETNMQSEYHAFKSGQQRIGMYGARQTLAANVTSLTIAPSTGTLQVGTVIKILKVG